MGPGGQPQCYIGFMAAHGICKITNGWVHQDSVWVQYNDGERLEIPASQYREENYQPPIDALPGCSGQHMPRGPKGEKPSAPPRRGIKRLEI
jgi:hypothetical protein